MFRGMSSANEIPFSSGTEMSQTGERGAIERKGRFLHFELQKLQAPHAREHLLGTPKEIGHEPSK